MPGWSEYSADQLYATLKLLDRAREHLDYAHEVLKEAGCPLGRGVLSPYAQILEHVQERKDVLHRLLGERAARKFAEAEKK
jgi:hypothetical protein